MYKYFDKSELPINTEEHLNFMPVHVSAASLQPSPRTLLVHFTYICSFCSEAIGKKLASAKKTHRTLLFFFFLSWLVVENLENLMQRDQRIPSDLGKDL